MHLSLDTTLGAGTEMRITSHLSFDFHVLAVIILISVHAIIHIGELSKVLILNTTRATKVLLQATQDDAL